MSSSPNLRSPRAIRGRRGGLPLPLARSPPSTQTTTATAHHKLPGGQVCRRDARDERRARERRESDREPQRLRARDGQGGAGAGLLPRWRRAAEEGSNKTRAREACKTRAHSALSALAVSRPKPRGRAAAWPRSLDPALSVTRTGAAAGLHTARLGKTVRRGARLRSSKEGKGRKKKRPSARGDPHDREDRQEQKDDVRVDLQFSFRRLSVSDRFVGWVFSASTGSARKQLN